MSHINEKSLHFSGNNLNKPHITLKKASFPLKMPSKSLVTFIKASHFSENVFKKPQKIFLNVSHYSKKPQITLKMPQFHCKCLQKAS
jgi:hypothetical protein